MSGNILAGTWGGKIYRSINNGQSFTRINNDMFVGFIWSLAVNSSGYIFAGTEQGVFCSTDNGTTWVMIGLALKDVRSIVIDSNTDLYAGTWGHGVFKSIDNGTTWAEANTGLSNMIVSALGLTSNSKLFAATFGNGIFKSVNHAASWTHLDLGYNLVWALGVTSTDVLFAGTYGDGLYKSTNTGTSRSKLFNGINAPYIYVSSWTSGVHTSSDYGNTWTSLGMGGFGVSCILVNPSMNVIYAGTKDGKIFMKSHTVTSVETKSEIPTEFSLKQNYPNPFNPSTNIEFGIPQSGKYVLKVFNILGLTVRVLADREFSAGYHKVTFEANDLASGIYIYQLFGEKVNMIKKMILVK
ncbi:MAG: T9SS type A sorting domain-containing protein [Bacteroidota bacterium]